MMNHMNRSIFAFLGFITFLHAAEPNQEKVLETIGNLNITFTEAVAEDDYKFIKQRLNDFRDTNCKPSEDYLLIDQSSFDPKTEEPSTFAYYMKTSRTLVISGLNDSETFKTVINIAAQNGPIQQCLYQMHVADLGDPEAILCFQFLKDNGFEKLQEFYNFEYGATTFDYVLKNIPKAWNSPIIPISSTPYTWVPFDESLEDECEANFGFLIRDSASNDEMVGGLFGTLRSDTSAPSAEISDLWVREDLRQRGLARKIMEYTRVYLKDKSIKLIELGTADFGPWQLYEKIGAKKVATYIGRMIRLDGSPVEEYIYQLDLSKLEKKS